MTFAERLARWNAWYDGAPELWRFQLVLWPLLILGAINMALTIAVGVPFALLVVLGILLVAVIRVPYVLGWVKTAEAGSPAGPSRMEIVGWPWVFDLNRWYDGLSEFRRPMVTLGVLVVAGAINMILTINGGFPFGLLFGLALLAMVLIRAPYVAGWLIDPAAARDGPKPHPAKLSHKPPAAIPSGETLAVTHEHASHGADHYVN